MTVIIDITQLTPGTVKGSDVYPAVDITDVTQADSGTTKKYEIAGLLDYILQTLGLITYIPVLTCSTVNLTSVYNNGVSGVNATLTNSGTQTAFSLNGQTGVIGGRYLIKDQTDPKQNGIYNLTNVGSGTTSWVLTRSSDFNSSSNIFNGGLVLVEFGSVNSNTLWQVIFTGSVIVGTTLFTWNLFNFTPDVQFTWNVVSGTTQQILNENGYIVSNGSLTTFTLPVNAAIGTIFKIKGYPGTGGWMIAQNSGQQMYVGSHSSSVGVLGSIASTDPTDCADATCINANNIWQITPIGNITIV